MKILVVDDHRIFCDGLRLILAHLEEQPEVLEADHCKSALELADSHPDLDLVMLDINMPDMDGCDALKKFSERFPTLPVVMLTASESMRDMRRSFDAGASGYIPKSSRTDIMLGAIRLVMAGSLYIPPSMAVRQRPADTAKSTPVDNEILEGLTQRQAEVLKHLQDGISNKQIADRMGLTEATVKVHMSAILKTLGLQSRLEAALVAQKLNGQSD
ncbi:MAG: response regulator transcription factor [Pseudomonadota bacterium]